MTQTHSSCSVAFLVVFEKQEWGGRENRLLLLSALMVVWFYIFLLYTGNILVCAMEKHLFRLSLKAGNYRVVENRKEGSKHINWNELEIIIIIILFFSHWNDESRLSS